MVAAAVPGNSPEETDGPMSPLPMLLGIRPTATPGIRPAAFLVSTDLVQKSATKVSAWHGCLPRLAERAQGGQWQRGHLPLSTFKRRHHKASSRKATVSRRQRRSAPPSLSTLDRLPPGAVREHNRHDVKMLHRS